jgi:uncharacterized membrane protein
MASESAPSFMARWGRVLLWSSLALNLLFIGMLAGAILRGPVGVGLRGGGPGQVMGFLQSLPKERREAVMREARIARGEIRELRRHVRDAARERREALTADVLDRSRVQAAQARLENAESRLRQMLTTVMLDAAGSMTREERKAFARFRGQPFGPPERDDEGVAPKN